MNNIGSQASESSASNYFMFRLNAGDSQYFAIDASEIKEIIVAPRLNKLPGYKGLVEGAFSLRDRVVSVVDTCVAIGKKAMSPDDKKFVVVIERDKKLFGLMAAQVASIFSKNNSELLPPPSSLGAKHCITAIFNHHPEGEAKGQGRLVSVLNTGQILTSIG